MTLAYAPAEGTPDPYAGFEARIVPENITLLPKTANQTTGGNSWNERAVMVKKGDNIVDRSCANSAPRPTRPRRSPPCSARADATAGCKEGQKLRILLSPVPARSGCSRSASSSPARMRSKRWSRCPTAENMSRSTSRASTPRSPTQRRRGRRRQRRAALPEHLRDGVAQPDAAAGHRRTGPHLLLRRRFPAQGAARRFLRRAVCRRGRTPAAEAKTDVLFASLTVGGEIKKFYRFQTTDDSVVDYYDETGKSAKKFLVRKPVGRRHHALRLRRRAAIRSSAT